MLFLVLDDGGDASCFPRRGDDKSCALEEDFALLFDQGLVLIPGDALAVQFDGCAVFCFVWLFAALALVAF